MTGLINALYKLFQSSMPVSEAIGVFMKIEVGKKYNNFLVLAKVGRMSGKGQRYYLCECVCGNQKEVRSDNLGKVKGCGCQRKAYQTSGVHKKRKPAVKTNCSSQKSGTLQIMNDSAASTRQADKSESTKVVPPARKPSTREQLENKLEEMQLTKELASFDWEM